MLSYNLVIAAIGCPSDKEHPPQMQSIEPCVVDIGLVEYQDAVRGKGQIGLFGHLDVMLAAICDHDERGNGALEIEQGMDLQGALALAVLGPGEEVEAKVNQCGVEYFERVVELEPVLGNDIGTTGEQVIVQALKELVVPARVNIAQLGAGDVLQPQVIPRPLLHLKSGLDVTQALLARCLGIEVDQQLAPGSKMLGVAVSPTTVHFAVELPDGDHA